MNVRTLGGRPEGDAIDDVQIQIYFIVISNL